MTSCRTCGNPLNFANGSKCIKCGEPLRPYRSLLEVDVAHAGESLGSKLRKKLKELLTKVFVTNTRGSKSFMDMADQLAAKTDVSDDDFRQLMQARAEAVQKYLLEAGQVSAERLFILAPKPADTTTKPQSRVTLSLN